MRKGSEDGSVGFLRQGAGGVGSLEVEERERERARGEMYCGVMRREAELPKVESAAPGRPGAVH